MIAESSAVVLKILFIFEFASFALVIIFLGVGDVALGVDDSLFLFKNLCFFFPLFSDGSNSHFVTILSSSFVTYEY